jgi:teichuronic acid biosynthesis glycosyltransferase TuaG
MNNPVISVITPSYNCEAYLEETIQSVQAQTFADWEMIIIDDCSKDKSFEIAERYAKEDNRITALRLDKNSGASKARNEGLKRVKGRYISFIDGDDLIMPDKFERQIAFMRDNDYAVTYTNYRCMSVDGSETGKLIRNPEKLTYQGLLKNTAMGTLMPIHDREKTGDHYFDESLPNAMDYAFWLTVLKQGITAHRFDHDMARYRRGHSSISSKFKLGRKIIWTIHREKENLGFLKACWCYTNYYINGIKRRYRF